MACNFSQSRRMIGVLAVLAGLLAWPGIGQASAVTVVVLGSVTSLADLMSADVRSPE